MGLELLPEYFTLLAVLPQKFKDARLRHRVDTPVFFFLSLYWMLFDSARYSTRPPVLGVLCRPVPLSASVRVAGERPTVNRRTLSRLRNLTPVVDPTR